ncbi:MAG TPA: flagellar basal body rod C-terminal domain-containing protein [Nevskia sp.]|nr:flagellar basal body rod C-terminal domain-containing protein [Nevskia sp.]
MQLDAQTSLAAQTTSERNSLSGVNLDEEAADLLRFQQAYQAAAQIISVASTVFDSLLAATRR